MVIILCAGERYQWEINAGIVQQFLPIDGTTILRRIVAQVREYEPIVITHRDDIRDHVPDVEFYEPRLHMNMADTFRSTQELWQEQTVVLFGDVIYGEMTIDQILKYRGGFKAIGDSAEIYAFMFSEANHKRLITALSVERLIFPGAAWVIYWQFCGLPRGSGRREMFRWVWDRCADVDDMREYAEAVKVWGK